MKLLVGNSVSVELKRVGLPDLWLFLMFIDPITVIDQRDQSDQSIPDPAVS